MPQGSTLGPIIFNIFLCDMFFIIDTTDIPSYADDRTPYSVEKSQCDRETKLQKASVKRCKSFCENDMKANQGKWHFLSSLDISSTFLPPAWILENSDSLKLLGVKIERKLIFNEHFTNVCDKASRKIQALATIYLNAKETYKEILFYFW